MEYNQIFRPDTLEKLNKRSQENLKKLIGDKTLMQTMMSSTKLLQEIMTIEAPYKEQLEQLAIQMAEDMYPIINEDGINIDAKIVSMGDVNKSLDEIKIERPIKIWDFETKPNKGDRIKIPSLGWDDKTFTYIEGDIIKDEKSNQLYSLTSIKRMKIYDDLENPYITESSPESKRRVINGITQGAALHGTFSFYMFKEYLDAIDDTLVEKYNQLMKEVFGVYDDDNAIAMFLQMIAQGQKMGGGSSKVIINEIKISKPDTKLYKIYPEGNGLWKSFRIGRTDGSELLDMFFDSIEQAEGYADKKGLKLISQTPINEQQTPTIQARAICFPMLVHEIIKGLYELVSLQGFQGDKEQNQQVVDKVDKIENEPHDLRYGKYIYEALNNIFADSGYDDSRIREFFFSEVYQLEDQEFIDFIENAINENLTPSQTNWIKQTLKEISIDLKDDDFDSTGLDEISIKKPGFFYNPNKKLNPFEVGKNVKLTIYNFVKNNKMVSEKQIINGLEDYYHIKTIQDNIRSSNLNREQVINPVTNKKIFVYYV